MIINHGVCQEKKGKIRENLGSGWVLLVFFCVHVPNLKKWMAGGVVGSGLANPSLFRIFWIFF